MRQDNLHSNWDGLTCKHNRYVGFLTQTHRHTGVLALVHLTMPMCCHRQSSRTQSGCRLLVMSVLTTVAAVIGTKDTTSQTSSPVRQPYSHLISNVCNAPLCNLRCTSDGNSVALGSSGACVPCSLSNESPSCTPLTQ